MEPHLNAPNWSGGYIPVQQGESDEETIRHAEEILHATLKEKENLLKKQL